MVKIALAAESTADWNLSNIHSEELKASLDAKTQSC